ncbi:MAG: hypothetical protein ACRDTE_13690, partial [Pseudonocardiaceae bacterium]
AAAPAALPQHQHLRPEPVGFQVGDQPVESSRALREYRDALIDASRYESSLKIQPRSTAARW